MLFFGWVCFGRGGGVGVAFCGFSFPMAINTIKLDSMFSYYMKETDDKFHQSCKCDSYHILLQRRLVSISSRLICKVTNIL